MGAFIVLPDDHNAENMKIPYKEYVLFLQQWEIPQPGFGKLLINMN